jgi:hypothetical protein
MTSCTGGLGTGTKYTYAELQGLWINAGGSSAVAPVAAAIALAESAGCSAALNPTDNGGAQTSVGLWQVSNGTHSYPAAWATPAGNATEAVAKYTGAGNSFSPWGTYVSGAYKAFMSGSTTPDTNVPGSGSGSAALASSQSTCLFGGQPLATLPIIGGVGTVPCLLTSTQARAVVGGLLLAGGVLLVLPGVLLLAAFAFRASGAARAVAPVVKTAAKVAEVAAV